MPHFTCFNIYQTVQSCHISDIVHLVSGLFSQFESKVLVQLNICHAQAHYSAHLCDFLFRWTYFVSEFNFRTRVIQMQTFGFRFFSAFYSSPKKKNWVPKRTHFKIMVPMQNEQFITVTQTLFIEPRSEVFILFDVSLRCHIRFHDQ